MPRRREGGPRPTPIKSFDELAKVFPSGTPEEEVGQDVAVAEAPSGVSEQPTSIEFNRSKDLGQLEQEIDAALAQWRARAAQNPNTAGETSEQIEAEAARLKTAVAGLRERRASGAMFNEQLMLEIGITQQTERLNTVLSQGVAETLPVREVSAESIEEASVIPSSTRPRLTLRPTNKSAPAESGQPDSVSLEGTLPGQDDGDESTGREMAEQALATDPAPYIAQGHEEWKEGDDEVRLVESTTPQQDESFKHRFDGDQNQMTVQAVNRAIPSEEVLTTALYESQGTPEELSKAERTRREWKKALATQIAAAEQMRASRQGEAKLPPSPWNPGIEDAVFEEVPKEDDAVSGESTRLLTDMSAGSVEDGGAAAAPAATPEAAATVGTGGDDIFTTLERSRPARVSSDDIFTIPERPQPADDSRQDPWGIRGTGSQPAEGLADDGDVFRMVNPTRPSSESDPVVPPVPGDVELTEQEPKRDRRTADRKQSDADWRDEGFKSKVMEARQVQDAYFDALREYQRGRSASSVAMESFIGDRVPKEVQALRQEWVASRAQLAKIQRMLVDISLDKKYEGEESIDERGPKSISRKEGETYREAVMRRYERRFVVPAAVLGAEEDEMAAKREGLSQRDKGTFDAVLDRYKAMPPWKRTLTTAAVVTGGVAAVTTLFGGAFVVSAVAAGGTAVAAGSRWLAEAKKSSNPRLAKVAEAVAGLTSVAGIAGAAAEGLLTAAHGVAGTKKRAKSTLENTDDLGDITSTEGLEKVSKKRKAAVETDEKIARQGRIARTIGAAAAGFAVGAYASGAGTESPSAEAPGAPSPEPAAGPLDKGPETVTPAPTPAEQPNVVPAIEKIPAGIEANVDEPGEGTDRVFRELKQAVAAAGIKDPAPALKHLLESDPNELSRSMGEAQYGDRGMITHYGDRLYVDENQNVWFDPKDGEPQLYLENKPDGSGFIEHEVTGKPLPPLERVIEPQAQTPSATEGQGTQADAGATPGEMLNITQQPFAGPPPAPTLTGQEQAAAQAGSPLVLGSLGSQPGLDENVLGELGAQDASPPAEAPPGQPIAGVEANRFGVVVDPTAPAPYEWRPEGSESAYVVVQGGSAAQAEAAARAFALAHPGQVALYVTQERGGLLGLGSLRDVVHGVQADAEANIRTIDTVRDAAGRAIPVPNASDFTRVVKPWSETH